MPFLRNCKRNPFARLLLFYIAGIATAPVLTEYAGGIWLLPAITGLTGLFFLPALLNPGFQTGWKSGMLVWLLLFSAGIWSFSCDVQRAERASNLPAARDIYRVRILSIPDQGEGFTRAMAKVLHARSGHDSLFPVKIRLYFTSACQTIPVPGEEILVHTMLLPVTPPGNPHEFNYARYLETRHIYRQAYAGAGDWKSCGEVCHTIPVLACRFRNMLMRCTGKAPLDPGARALLNALTLGYRDDVDAATEAAFSRAGVMHIMALSGFNVGMVASVILLLSGGFRKNRSPGITAMVLTLLVVWMFVVVTGMSASVTRAAVMISLGLTGIGFRKRVNTANILFASAFIMLAVTPRMLFDAGFQLSFAAVAGILMFDSLQFRPFFSRFPLYSKIWQLFILSCAAQLSTLPFTLFYFHQFPLYFWLTNLYVVPLVSVIICTAMVFLALSWWGFAVAVLGKALGLMLKMLFFSVSLPEHLPGSLIGHIYITPLQAFCLALLVLFLAAFLAKHKPLFLRFILFGLILFQCLGIVRHMQNERQKIFMVASVRRTTALIFAGGRHSCLVMDPFKPSQDKALSYSLDGFFLSRGLKPEFFDAGDSGKLPLGSDLCPGLTCRGDWRGSNLLIGFNGRKIVLLRDNRFERYRVGHPLQVDFLVISKGMNLSPEKVLEEVDPAMVILDASVTYRQQERWIRALAPAGIHVHSVSAKGAFLDEQGNR